jgi:Dolichyl-phosphate-mannose-protein mannosyltransferase
VVQSARVDNHRVGHGSADARVNSAPEGTAFRRQVLLALIVGLGARILWILLLPMTAISSDLRAWDYVANDLEAGRNPYVTTQFVSWPPAWIQVVSFLAGIARHFGWPLDSVIRAFLIGVDGACLLMVGALIRRLVGPTRVLSTLLLGWSLNPVPVLLVCQHGNFDGLIAFCVLAALWFLARFHETQDATDWLWADAFLGVGIVLKTIPLVLTPLLATGRHLRRLTLLLGLALVLAPAAYGFSVIYALAPRAVAANVIGYRSIPGWFGVSGLLALGGRAEWVRPYTVVFVCCLAAGSLILAARLWNHWSPTLCLLTAAVLLAAIPALGPGYGSQYIGWFWPLLLTIVVVCSGRTRAIILIFAAVAAVTYVIEYALIPSHGAFLASSSNDVRVLRLSETAATPRGATLLRLPLFAAYLALLAGLGAAVRRQASRAGAAGWE